VHVFTAADTIALKLSNEEEESMGARRSLAVLAAGLGLMVATGTAQAGSAHHHGNVTCRGGTITPGHYRSLTIKGVCTLGNSGTVSVRHDVVVRRGGILNAVTQGTLRVGGDVVVGRHGVAGIGCSAEVGCNTPPDDVIRGSVRANGAWAVIVHAVTIGHNVRLVGGGGSMNCASTALLGGPYYFDVEDSTVGGNVLERRIHSCWLGFIRDTVGGTVTLKGNRFGDPDAMEIVTNTIGGDLNCFNNVPQAHVGDSMGAPNVVGGVKRGECKAL
jgi:hypothetical protein